MLRHRLVLLLALVLSGLSMNASAQGGGGLFTGRVVGPDGEPLPGITVSITVEPLEPQGEPIQASAKPDGSFRIPLPRPGRYRLTATAQGFPDIQREFNFTPGSLQALDLRFLGATGPSSGPEANPTWNKWAMEESPGAAPGTQPFLAEHSYVVSFDLAGIDYRELVEDSSLSAEPDPKLKRFLAEKTSLRLLAKPFLQGEGLSFASAQAAEPQRVAVELDRLKRPAALPQPLSPGDPQALLKVSARLSAARFDVEVQADKPGQALVGLILWDALTRQPLDVQTFPVTIRARAGEPGPTAVTPPAATAAPSGSAVSSNGLQSLLSTPSSFRADASLSVFELEEGVNLVVFLGPQDEPRSWSPRRSIREFVSEEGPNQFGLVRQLQSVHCPSPSPLFCREDYSQVSGFFSSILFSDPDPQRRREAKLAKEELEHLVDTTTLPTVATRFIDASGVSRPIPLGLLGLSKGRLLGEVAYITQPLPKERPVTAAGCIRDFNTLIPTSLALSEDECERADFDELLRPAQPPASPFLSDFEAMQSFFRDDTPRSSPQGLLLLAHHADGFLSFSPGFSPALLAEDMTRRYGEGSVAVLIGCAVGGLSPLNRRLPLLSTLNDGGVDAMIFSPFSINAELGSRLAIHFSAAIEEARRARKEISFFELYQRALAATRKDPTVKPFLGELAELTLAGRGDLKLCPTAPAAKTAASKPKDANPATAAAAPRRCCCCGGLAGRLGGSDGPGSNNGGIKNGVGLAEILAVLQCGGSRSGRCNCGGNGTEP